MPLNQLTEKIMKALNTISSDTFANSVMTKIDKNFTDVKAAIDDLENSGSGSGGGESSNTGMDKVFVNGRMGAYKDTIKVLSLGNSYAQNSMAYIADFLSAAGASSSGYYTKVMRPSGQSLQGWWNTIATNGSDSSPATRGSATMIDPSGVTGVRKELSRDWDVITIQQNSDNVANYATYEPYISDIISAIRFYCPNKAVKIALHMVWDKHRVSSQYDTHFSEIVEATKSVCRKNGIDMVIPTGTAIANARKAFGNSMMRDSSGHLAYGVARYIACSTWYQVVFAPFYGVDIENLDVLHDMGTYDSVTESASDTNAAIVDDSNKQMCQQCALAAVNDMWNITTIS